MPKSQMDRSFFFFFFTNVIVHILFASSNRELL